MSAEPAPPSPSASTCAPRTPPRLDRVILVTGLSGAGKTSTLKALEDLGFEAIDNVPLDLIARLVGPAPTDTPSPSPSSSTPTPTPRDIAIGVDVRTRGFAVETFVGELDHLRAIDDIDVSVIFLDCAEEELQRRFAETRRRHPLAVDLPLTDAIALERAALAPLIDRADMVLDTTDSILGDLKGRLKAHFVRETGRDLAIFVISFSYRHGLPRQADLVFDVRFLKNPHYDLSLRPLTGRDEAVARFIENDPGWDTFFQGLCAFLTPLLPRYRAEGKSYLTLALGCTGGRHRSVFTAEKIAEWLMQQGLPARLTHRELPTEAATRVNN
ncbi:RNase adapter RapZ [Varunaivibrio sulfuroxidans]|uniref:UPF0042 nucleotide-binding protein n=1 Tax=Varunaivibrio sulfuroxidans TaxID=1773489 RepID=A0A4R3J883_9PROT|nr:RNase adapter RapZ [Varunaivibrio sulfuroxidans]TCS61654.1 UPF0042 nucleotide-binding protein [Varunaivibrio sulfuroxidans]WES29475.1 RNase adapter RapZ [Varunaivibrio sulfuroxidans]